MTATRHVQHSLPRGLWTAMLLPFVLVLVALPVAASHQAVSRSRAAGAFRLVATHPGASRQPTALGATLSTLAPWHGLLYPGYGDYTTNTGPIAISPFDPATLTFRQAWVSDTESIENYRAIGGKLYAPAIDPRSKADYAVGEPWRDVQPVGSIHAYDMATLDGRDLWLVGAESRDGVAWRSPDGGATWAESLRIAPGHGIAGDFTRLYFAGVLANRLYVQATDAEGGAHPRSRVFDGTRWQDGPDLLPRGGSGWRPVPFNGHLLYHSTELAGFLTAFNGTVAKYMVGWSTMDVTVDGDTGRTLYVLRSVYNYEAGRFDDPVVMRTPDLDHWEALSPSAPAGARSVARLGGKLYVGGTGGQLFGYDGGETWTAAETVWNRIPSVGEVQPSESVVHIAPATIPIRVHPTDPDGPVASVKVWRGADLIGEDTRPPFLILWQGAPAGRHVLKVRVTDGANAYHEATMAVTVVDGVNDPPTLSRPPSADPSPAYSFEPVRFQAPASDPERDPLSFEWDFGDGTSLTGNPVTRVFTQYGNFVITLTVSDGRGGVVQGTVDLRVDEGIPPAAFIPVAVLRSGR